LHIPLDSIFISTRRAELYNVLINFDFLPYPTTDRLKEPIEMLELGPNDAIFVDLPATIYNTGVLLVSRFNIACPFTPGAELQPSTTIKTKGGKCYRYMIASVGLDMRC
jgi:hypothetical protein